MKELRVSAIEKGTVIDHIPSKEVMKVVKILGIADYDNMILIGTNLESKKYPNKGVIKIANAYLNPREINKICLFAPKATIVTIENYEVVSKEIVQIPDNIEGIVKCHNKKCITNFEEIETKFEVIEKTNGIKLKCHYCEKVSEGDQIRII